jgi:hypothetical protein
MKLPFYKKEGRWYADLPEYIHAGGTEADCEMVAGADTWLDFLSNNGTNITLEIDHQEPLSNKITRIGIDDFGATYIAHEYNEEIVNHVLWICPVTLFVFGEYPETIYFQIVNE